MEKAPGPRACGAFRAFGRRRQYYSDGAVEAPARTGRSSNNWMRGLLREPHGFEGFPARRKIDLKAGGGCDRFHVPHRMSRRGTPPDAVAIERTGMAFGGGLHILLRHRLLRQPRRPQRLVVIEIGVMRATLAVAEVVRSLRTASPPLRRCLARALRVRPTTSTRSPRSRKSSAMMRNSSQRLVDHLEVRSKPSRPRKPPVSIDAATAGKSTIVLGRRFQSASRSRWLKASSHSLARSPRSPATSPTPPARRLLRASVAVAVECDAR